MYKWDKDEQRRGRAALDAHKRQLRQLATRTAAAQKKEAGLANRRAAVVVECVRQEIAEQFGEPKVAPKLATPTECREFEQRLIRDGISLSPAINGMRRVGNDNIAVEVTVPGEEELKNLPAAKRVKFYMDNYIKSLEETERQKQRLIRFRGGEDRLTNSDQTTLENIEDMVKYQYERLLDV